MRNLHIKSKWNSVTVAEFLEKVWVTSRTSGPFKLHFGDPSDLSLSLDGCESETYRLLKDPGTLGQQFAALMGLEVVQ